MMRSRPQGPPTPKPHSFLHFFSLQAGVILYTSVIFVVRVTAVLYNLTATNHYSSRVTLAFSFTVLLVFALSSIISLVFVSTGAFLFQSRLSKFGTCFLLTTECIWLLLSILGFIPQISSYKYVCVDERCPSTQWMYNEGFRQDIRNCPEITTETPDNNRKLVNNQEQRQSAEQDENQLDDDPFWCCSSTNATGTNQSVEYPTKDEPYTEFGDSTRIQRKNTNGLPEDDTNTTEEAADKSTIPIILKGGRAQDIEDWYTLDVPTNVELNQTNPPALSTADQENPPDPDETNVGPELSPTTRQMGIGIQNGTGGTAKLYSVGQTNGPSQSLVYGSYSERGHTGEINQIPMDDATNKIGGESIGQTASPKSGRKQLGSIGSKSYPSDEQSNNLVDQTNDPSQSLVLGSYSEQGHTGEINRTPTDDATNNIDGESGGQSTASPKSGGKQLSSIRSTSYPSHEHSNNFADPTNDPSRSLVQGSYSDQGHIGEINQTTMDDAKNKIDGESGGQSTATPSGRKLLGSIRSTSYPSDEHSSSLVYQTNDLSQSLVHGSYSEQGHKGELNQTPMDDAINKLDGESGGQSTASPTSGRKQLSSTGSISYPPDEQSNNLTESPKNSSFGPKGQTTNVIQQVGLKKSSVDSMHHIGRMSITTGQTPLKGIPKLVYTDLPKLICYLYPFGCKTQPPNKEKRHPNPINRSQEMFWSMLTTHAETGTNVPARSRYPAHLMFAHMGKTVTSRITRQQGRDFDPTNPYVPLRHGLQALRKKHLRIVNFKEIYAADRCRHYQFNFLWALMCMCAWIAFTIYGQYTIFMFGKYYLED